VNNIQSALYERKVNTVMVSIPSAGFTIVLKHRARGPGGQGDHLPARGTIFLPGGPGGPSSCQGGQGVRLPARGPGGPSSCQFGVFFTMDFCLCGAILNLSDLI
jgi:hypothetical protein